MDSSIHRFASRRGVAYKHDGLQLSPFLKSTRKFQLSFDVIAIGYAVLFQSKVSDLTGSCPRPSRGSLGKQESA